MQRILGLRLANKNRLLRSTRPIRARNTAKPLRLPLRRNTSRLHPSEKVMPRIPRGELSGEVFHVLRRGNNRATILHDDADDRAFLRLLAATKDRYPVRVFAFSVLPNHFHAVLQASDGTCLSRFMHWWLTSHVRRYHRHHGTSGHVWQGRFKSFPIQQDEHLWTVIRYVLLNPVRARLSERAEQWPWSSLRHAKLVDPWPVTVPRELARLVGLAAG